MPGLFEPSEGSTAELIQLRLASASANPVLHRKPRQYYRKPEISQNCMFRLGHKVDRRTANHRQRPFASREKMRQVKVCVLKIARIRIRPSTAKAVMPTTAINNSTDTLPSCAMTLDNFV